MGRKRHTPEQIITALREAEVGQPLGLVFRGGSVVFVTAYITS